MTARPLLRLFAAWLALASLAAGAADRPFIYANSAAAEEDEEQVWSVENWYRRAGGQQSLTVAPEYAFDPVNSLQLELRRVVTRDEANGHELELEYKHLFTRIERDGWGLGVVATLDFARAKGSPWQRSATTLLVPLTLPVGERLGLVHLNVGIAKPREEKRLVTGALAGEHFVTPRTTLFAELARDDEGRLAQVGVRHWLKREKLAVDAAWQRLRGDERRGSGVVLGIAWYDL